MEDTNKSPENLKKVNAEVITMTLEEVKKAFTKEHPHPTGAYWAETEQKWRGYKPTKGINPPWMPYAARHRAKRITISERKFLMVLSQTGSMTEAFKAAYKYTVYDDKRLESARISAAASNVLRRVKAKAPDLVAAYKFDDVNPDFIKHEMMKLYNHDHATIPEKTRLLELMGKTQAMFTEKTITDIRIKDVVNTVYQESDEDFPDTIDQRISRTSAPVGVLKNPEEE